MTSIPYDYAGIRTRQAELSGGPVPMMASSSADPAVALAERFLPLYENWRAAQAALVQASEDYEDARGLPRRGIIDDYQDPRLIELMRQDRTAEIALAAVERPMLSALPTSPAGVAALIQVAIAYIYDHDYQDDDQPPEVRVLQTVLRYFGCEARAA
jgi:hypothetical protein